VAGELDAVASSTGGVGTEACDEVADGFSEADSVGVGWLVEVGFAVGVGVGLGVGGVVGLAVGLAVGLSVGLAVGWAVGFAVGWAVGLAVGGVVGGAVGGAVGLGAAAHVIENSTAYSFRPSAALYAPTPM
jgi:hypothetical protein